MALTHGLPQVSRARRLVSERFWPTARAATRGGGLDRSVATVPSAASIEIPAERFLESIIFENHVFLSCESEPVNYSILLFLLNPSEYVVLWYMYSTQNSKCFK